jgi:short-subunit dehydrogenase
MKTNPSGEGAVLITGASSGIGEAVARRFTRSGWNCGLAARSYERLVKLGQELESLYPAASCLPLRMDVTDIDSIQSGVQACLARFGHIKVLVNNAGTGRLGWLELMSPQEDIRKSIEVNLVGSMLVTRAVLPEMLRRRRGHIILMASMASFVATPTYSLYAASKFGMRGFAEALRREVSAWGVKVSAVYPSSVDTAFAQASVAARRTGVTTPNWLRLSPAEVADAVYALTRKPRPTLVLPRMMRLVIWFNRVWPGLLDLLTRRLFVERERREALETFQDSSEG